MGDRERLIARLRARVDEHLATGDHSLILDRAAVSDARLLARLAQGKEHYGEWQDQEFVGYGDIPAQHAIGLLHWYRYRALPPEAAEADLQAALTNFLPCFIAGDEAPEPVDFPDAGLPLLADEAEENAARLLEFVAAGDNLELISHNVGLWQRIVAATPTRHAARGRRLGMLAIALRARFERAGAAEDLDAAISAGRASLSAAASHTTDVSDSERGAYMTALALSLLARYRRTGAQNDLNSAVDLLERTTGIEWAPAAAKLGRVRAFTNLGTANIARFERTSQESALDEAIRSLQEAMRLATSGPDPDPSMLSAPLSELATALLYRFHMTGTRDDLGRAIEAMQQTVRITPGWHRRRPWALNNLAELLRFRYRREGEVADIDCAIELTAAALEACPADDPRRAFMMYQQGAAYGDRYRHLGERSDLQAALSALERTVRADVATPSLRIVTAQEAADLAAEHDVAKAAALLETAVRLLPETTPQALPRSDRQHALGRLPGLAADAAALALAAPGPAEANAVRALQLLEAGRAVMLSQALDTRSDLTDLTERHPELAARFITLRDRLDGESPAGAGSLADSGASGGGAAERRGQVAREFTELVTRIRAIEGFGTFALPPSTEELLAQAGAGPIVVFNVSRYRSDALLLTGDAVTSLALPELSADTVRSKVVAFHRALETTVTPGSGPAARVAAQAEVRGVLAWLWTAGMEPVLQALGYDSGPPPGAGWPRVWWIPGGHLSLLPLHAAGHHDDPPGLQRRTVLDRVVSSYTPTVRALHHARTRANGRPAASNALVVAMPTTPGVPGRLHHVSAEAAFLRARLPDPTMLVEPDEGRPAADGSIPTRARVLAHLPGHAVAHFACHGFSHPSDPSQSALLLHDHRDDRLDVAGLAAIDLREAQLAYLSACQTTVTAATELLDEAVHLSSAFQLLGFSHVIGTLWQINDRVAAEVAERFYDALRTGDGAVDASRAPYALHYAIRDLRQRAPSTPSLWAAHLHVGA
ncbi:CHAT domain-containing protein [Spirillospora sp. CA-255316]